MRAARTVSSPASRWAASRSSPAACSCSPVASRARARSRRAASAWAAARSRSCAKGEASAPTTSVCPGTEARGRSPVRSRTWSHWPSAAQARARVARSDRSRASTSAAGSASRYPSPTRSTTSSPTAARTRETTTCRARSGRAGASSGHRAPMRAPSLKRASWLPASADNRSRVRPLRAWPHQVGGAVRRAREYEDVTGISSLIAPIRWSRWPHTTRDRPRRRPPRWWLRPRPAPGGTCRQVTGRGCS